MTDSHASSAFPPIPRVDVVVDGGAVGATRVFRERGGHRITVVLKASFQVVHDGPAIALSPVPIALRDEVIDGVLVAASEMAPYLPYADVLLSGHACAPRGQPMPATSIRLGVSREGRPLLDKVLHVLGDRDPLGAAPRPFERMPITYARAYGGKGHPDNPIGVGGVGAVAMGEAPKPPAFPNITAPGYPDVPAGLGPIAPDWGPRRRLLGHEPMPREGEIPERIDPRFFQAAPADQQIQYLEGDEWIVLDGFDPDLPRMLTRLPGARAEARVSFGARRAPEVVRLVADMLVIDVDRRVLSLIYRGSVHVEDAESCRGASVQAALTLPGSGGRSALAALSPLAALSALSPSSVRGAPVAPAAPAALGPSVPFEHRGTGTLPLVDDRVRAALAALPFDGRREEPAAKPVVEETVSIVARALTEDPVVEREVVPATPAPKVPARIAYGPSGTRERVEDAHGAGRPLGEIAMAGAALDGLDLHGADLRGADLRGTDLRGCNLSEARLTGADLTGADLSFAKLCRADLSRTDLSKASLASADLTGADLRDAIVRGAALSGASCAEACFASADLTDAGFADADLSRAVLESATLVRCDMSRAEGPGARFEHANLRKARFDGAEMTGAVFTDADMRDTSLRNAHFEGADLTRARLDGADVTGAVISGEGFST